MRVVATGLVPGPGGPIEVYAKVRRPVTAVDRARRRWFRPRGPAEGALLQGLSQRGVPVPRVLGWSAGEADAPDLLVVEAVEGARPLAECLAPPADRAARLAAVEGVGRLLRRAHDAGLAHRDLHRENVVVGRDGPALLDPGAARLRAPLPPARRIRLLGLAAHGLGADARTGLRALRAYLDGDREKARRWLRDVSRDAATARREYRRGRARRARRTGLHFEVFEPAGPATTGVRSKDRAPAAWKEGAARWIALPPEGARPLKADGAVVAARLPGLEEEVVLKRYPPRWKDRWRTPRAIRAFRTAYTLRIRGVECPEPLLAAVDATRAGVYVAARAGARAGGACLDLHEATRPGARGRLALAARSPAERRDALHRLGRFLRRLHDAEVSHRDLKAPNVVAYESGGRVRFEVVDLEGARPLRGPVSWRRRAKDLARLDASVGPPVVSRADRVRVLRAYVLGWARPPVDLATFAAWVAEDRARKLSTPGGAPGRGAGGPR
jgi:tRNA A-37 threonylcarbamoyl transferase component Bud32